MNWIGSFFKASKGLSDADTATPAFLPLPRLPLVQDRLATQRCTDAGHRSLRRMSGLWSPPAGNTSCWRGQGDSGRTSRQDRAADALKILIEKRK